MGEFFNLDNKFFQGINKVIDCVLLNVLWIFCCVPLITAFLVAWQSGVALYWVICWLTFALAGPATTALYYAINKVVRHGRSYIWKEYWHAFFSNFKQAAAAALVVAGLGLFMVLDCYIMYQFAKAGEKSGALYAVFLIFILLIVMWATYVFPYIARFENKLLQVLKNTALIAIANLPWTFVLLVVLIVSALLVWAMPPVLVIVPSVYMLIANFILEKVFLKYMSKEDIATEEERNREFYN
ncbi:MAG: DUF624 domain-containing protein [Clostridiales bacterium]|nr:DUF624 domain-containing protein [Roseburia sp.]MDD7637386.1 DUF624 domain-containing protein [Clostridiales bacterium]MDY4113339.1 DUF624 domain-containing protein [Roseburia sp.]